MTAHIPRLFTIAPDKPFLEVLADEVLKGFPCTDGRAPGKLDLARWTILLPTRRAVRELEDIFFRRSGGSGGTIALSGSTITSNTPTRTCCSPGTASRNSARR